MIVITTATQNTMKIALTHPTTRRQQGFSLFELLMAIAIIGILGSLAMPLFAGQQVVAHELKTKRNAQELVIECAGAQAGGVDFVVEGDLDATLANLKAGAVATTGVFQGRQFGIRGMAVEEIELSKVLLDLRDGSLLLK
jgi:prepilin-type N-terminal cleavage/methylation domain-containing protein